MPFQSEKQRRFLHANHPEIAKRWEREYATGGISNHFRRRVGLKKGSSDGPGPGGQGARGQATQNPGSSGGPPGGGSGGQGGAMHYQAPTPTYQNVHQTGAISQTPGQTITTTGDGKTGDHHPPIRPKKTYGPYTPKNKYLPHYPALSKWQKKEFKDWENRAKKGTHGGYGPYSDTWTKIQHQPSLSKWQKKEFKDWETLVKKGAHGGYGPYTNPWEPVDLGLVEELSTKDYTSSGPSMDEMGQWYDADGKPIDNPNINPELAGMIKPIAAVKEDFVKKQSWYKSPLKLKTNLSGMVDPEVQTFKSHIKGGLTIEKYLDLSKKGLIPDSQKATFEKQVLKAIKEQGGFEETFQEDWSSGVVEPTFKDGKLDIDVEALNPSEMVKPPKHYLEVAKGGVARKNYFHGGILDINESEEIISDDGNDIELTAYNAEFDDPKDLSTGVKTLFQAKDGGTPRRRYFTGAYGGGGADQDDTGGDGNTNRERGIQQAYSQPAYSPTGDASVAEQIAADDRQRKQDIKDIIARGDEEKYDTDLVDTKGESVMTPEENYLARRNMIKSKYTGRSIQRKNALAKNYNDERAKLEKAMNKKIFKIFGLAFLGKPPTLSSLVSFDPFAEKKLTGLVPEAYALDQLKKQHIADLTDIKDALLEDVDINNPNEMANLDDTAFPDVMKELKDLTKPRDEEDDAKGDGPEVPKVVPIGEEIDAYAQGPHRLSAWEQIKANQAKKAMLVEKGIHTEYNPIVGEAVTDITMEANRGGLANLFRVKNQ